MKYRVRLAGVALALTLAVPAAAQEAPGPKAGAPVVDASRRTPSPAAKRRKIVERKVEAVKLKKRTGPTASELAKKQFAGKQRPSMKRFEDPMERNRALIEAKRAAIEKRRHLLLARLKRIYDRVRDQGGNPKKEAELLHRMAELQWESGRYKYFQKRFVYEKEMDAFLDGKSKTKPAEPKPDYTVAMETYRHILRDHPSYKRIDEVIYYLGDGLRLLGKDGDAAPYFQKLVKGHPKSKFISDALLGLAEYFFKSDLLFAARDTYLKIVNGHRTSKVYNYALYKLGWAYYNLGGMDKKNFRLCIETFKRVIATIDDSKTKTKHKIQFRGQALKDLVIAFASVDTGLEEAREYFTKRGGKPLAFKMVDRLGKFYLATDKDEKAIAVYRWFMAEQPTSPKLAEWSQTVLESLKKIGKQKRVEKEMLALVDRFKPDSIWMKANIANAKLVQTGRDLAEGSLEYLASHYHQEAQRLKEQALYLKAARFYKLFIDSFPKSKKAYRARFYLAEITLLKAKNPAEAAGYYKDVIDAGPGEFLADATYGRITCFDNLMKAARNRTKVGEGFKYKNVGSKMKSGGYAKRPIPKWEKLFVEASDDYVRLVKRPSEAVPVMYNAAEIFFYNNHYEAAVKRYAYIVDNHPSDKHALYAANNILESYNRLENWREIERWAKRLRDNPKFKARSRKELNKFIALAIFNQANKMRDDKQHHRAAAELLRLQAELPKSSLSDEALFSAASLYSEGKQHDMAIKTFERLLKAYPKSPKTTRATFLIGAIYESLAHFAKAADYFEQRADSRDSKSKEARNALFNAGLIREARGERDHAVRLYRKFLKRFPKSKDARSLYMRIAKIHERGGRTKTARDAFDAFRRRFRKDHRAIEAGLRAALADKKLGRTRRLARRLKDLLKAGKRTLKGLTGEKAKMVQRWLAHARYLEGEREFAEYAALKFSLPQRVMVRQIRKKAKMLKNVTTIYQDVLTFKSAGWSACALHKIGKTYHDFSQALLEAPIPRGLNADEIQIYKIKLQEKALPVEEKAFAAYARNLKEAAKNNVFNDCVQHSGNALAKAKPEEFPVVKEKAVHTNHVAQSLNPAPLVLNVPAPAPAKSSSTGVSGGTTHASR